jgi:dihydrofolate synthase/folylpolyglutamate synthase
MRFSTLDEWLQWQERLHPSSKDLGLERPARVLHSLKLNSPQHLTITVAGTNGKGSTVAVLEAILTAAGYRVGSYTSPHLLHYNERIKVNGQPVSDELICEAFDRLDQARGETSLTYFEFGTLAALSIFQHEPLDVVLLEVGLGGRLDAVNLIDADMAIITAIDIDHVAWLGADRESIGYEKAGIMRTGRPALCSDPQPPQSLVAHAEKIGANLKLLGRDFNYTIDGAGGWSLEVAGERLDSLPQPNLPGRAQYQNCAGAVAALLMLSKRLRVSRDEIVAGLRAVSVPGRFQKIGDNPEVIVDVAHNPQSARHLAETLCSHPCVGRRYAVVAMLTDKDQKSTLEPLAGLFDHWLVGGLDIERGDGGEGTRSVVDALTQSSGYGDVRLFGSVPLAYTEAKRLALKGDQIIVFGSFFTVALILGLKSSGAGEDS